MNGREKSRTPEFWEVDWMVRDAINETASPDEGNGEKTAGLLWATKSSRHWAQKLEPRRPSERQGPQENRGPGS